MLCALCFVLCVFQMLCFDWFDCFVECRFNFNFQLSPFFSRLVSFRSDPIHFISIFMSCIHFFGLYAADLWTMELFCLCLCLCLCGPSFPFRFISFRFTFRFTFQISAFFFEKRKKGGFCTVNLRYWTCGAVFIFIFGLCMYCTLRTCETCGFGKNKKKKERKKSLIFSCLS